MFVARICLLLVQTVQNVWKRRCRGRESVHSGCAWHNWRWQTSIGQRNRLKFGNFSTCGTRYHPPWRVCKKSKLTGSQSLNPPGIKPLVVVGREFSSKIWRWLVSIQRAIYNCDETWLLSQKLRHREKKRMSFQKLKRSSERSWQCSFGTTRHNHGYYYRQLLGWSDL